MKWSLKIEELLMLLMGVYAFHTLTYSWWWFLALFLLPDLGMLGYLFNPRIGAITYNLCHHKAIAVALFLLGVYTDLEMWKLIGVILFSHASFDRIFGYGLKYFDDFKNTHLGKLL
ncbi:DUF4260 domain-containing protein [Mangrovimonas sp. YM274]|uniref:DUF4260 domain-containing protein n=1 Tax=Mangrovimonas sp. YM274 TaxID=3070660 RepID=UPI0027DDF5B9|nr:DUF4260 domain-containing protein [Mangrovimonas sp. YM274]WMI68577.1 DUF4260 domain-containing protein [Mangrovimonas sp. YM274]